MRAGKPALDASCRALIFRAARGAVHHGALATARTLGRLGVPVYAVVKDAYEPVVLSRYLRKAFVWESWPPESEVLLEIAATARRFIGHQAVLLPLDDLSAVLIAENAEALKQFYLIPRLPADVPRKMANKASMQKLCACAGIPYVRSRMPQSFDDLRAFADEAGYPIVIKAVEQWRLIHDRFNVLVIENEAALAGFSERQSYEQLAKVIVQEYVPGEDWIYHGCRDSDRNVCLSFTGKKLRGYPVNFGSTSVGLSIHNPIVRDQSEALLDAISYSGISDMDWRKDVRDGQYKLLDCNPRVGQNFRMFQNGAGIDVVRAQHLVLTGRGVGRDLLCEGRLFKVESFQLMSMLRGEPRAQCNDKAVGPIEDKELAWWSRDDPLPPIVMYLYLGAIVIMKLVNSALSNLNHRLRTLRDRLGPLRP